MSKSKVFPNLWIHDLMACKLRNGRVFRCSVLGFQGDSVTVFDEDHYCPITVKYNQLRKLDPALTYIRKPFKRVNELNMQRLVQNRNQRKEQCTNE